MAFRRKTTGGKSALSRVPSVKPFRPTQQQILYTLLLVATFLVGYLLATVQMLKNPSGTTQAANPNAVAGAQQTAPPSFTNDDIKAWASEVDLDQGQFGSCFDSNKFQENVTKDTNDGSTAGVSGTPTFYINGVQLVGAQPFDAFKTAIDQELSGNSTAAKTTVDVGHLPVLGDENAPVTIIEFSDLECPFCNQFFKNTFPQLKAEYIDTGKAKMYFRHYPLPFHPMATPFANAVECANEQGKFWELHDLIFSKQ